MDFLAPWFLALFFLVLTTMTTSFIMTVIYLINNYAPAQYFWNCFKAIIIFPCRFALAFILFVLRMLPVAFGTIIFPLVLCSVFAGNIFLGALNPGNLQPDPCGLQKFHLQKPTEATQFATKYLKLADFHASEYGPNCHTVLLQEPSPPTPPKFQDLMYSMGVSNDTAGNLLQWTTSLQETFESSLPGSLADMYNEWFVVVDPEPVEESEPVLQLQYNTSDEVFAMYGKFLAEGFTYQVDLLKADLQAFQDKAYHETVEVWWPRFYKTIRDSNIPVQEQYRRVKEDTTVLIGRAANPIYDHFIFQQRGLVEFLQIQYETFHQGTWQPIVKEIDSMRRAFPAVNGLYLCFHAVFFIGLFIFTLEMFLVAGATMTIWELKGSLKAKEKGNRNDDDDEMTLLQALSTIAKDIYNPLRGIALVLFPTAKGYIYNLFGKIQDILRPVQEQGGALVPMYADEQVSSLLEGSDTTFLLPFEAVIWLMLALNANVMDGMYVTGKVYESFTATEVILALLQCMPFHQFPMFHTLLELAYKADGDISMQWFWLIAVFKLAEEMPDDWPLKDTFRFFYQALKKLMKPLFYAEFRAQFESLREHYTAEIEAKYPSWPRNWVQFAATMLALDSKFTCCGKTVMLYSTYSFSELFELLKESRPEHPHFEVLGQLVAPATKQHKWFAQNISRVLHPDRRPENVPEDIGIECILKVWFQIFNGKLQEIQD